MRLHQIKLTNLRAFESFDLALDRQLTVLAGRNGVGKSTVLDGIAVALGAWVGAFRSIKEDATLDASWARRVRAEVEGVALVEPRFPVRVEVQGALFGRPVSWARELRSVEGRTTTGESADLRQRARVLEDGLPSLRELLPLVAYYGTGRLWVQKRERAGPDDQVADKSRLAGYRAALAAASDQKGFRAWMARMERDRIQRLAKAHESGRPLTDVDSPLLEMVSRTACACLEGAARFYYSANHEELRVDFEDGSTIPFTDLSDGQRNIIAVAADLAWRAAQLNPQLGELAPALTEGVVLIDEVELHLHPAWQARVLGDLTGLFPRLQFVVTTHAPQVMAAADVRTIRLIDRQHEAHEVSARGKSANVVLEDLLGVPARPASAKEALSELDALIESGRLDEARGMLLALEGQWLGADDPDVVAARWELEMAERAAAREQSSDATDPEGT